MKSKFSEKLVAAVLIVSMSASGLLFGGLHKFSAQTPVRVDINRADNRQGAYTEDYENWNLKTSERESYTFENLTFTLSNGGINGKQITGSNYKGLIKPDGSTPTRTMDGAVIKDAAADDGNIIRMDIEGLSEGEHSLATWHSNFDLVSGSSVSIYVNGELKAEHIKSTTRVEKDFDAGIAYIKFTAKQGKVVTVLIKPEGDGEFNNAVLNAFEIDCPYPGERSGISNIIPADGDLHFDAGEGFSWQAGNDSVSFDVYMGTDYAAVENATHESSEFQGNQTKTEFSAEKLNLSHIPKYYWRIDEHTASGIVKGKVMTFGLRHLAFPSAEGYGRFARGGRGGRVIEVTNLNDSGPGSLREAIENEKGPRTIVFRVGGVIELESRLSIPADGGEVYVAGQTAPGDGITLTRYAFGIFYAKDVIIRHVRLRVGDYSGVSMDGIGMAGADHSIVDHCSIAWTTDEGTSSRGAHNITFQHNLIAEALNNSVHYDAGDRDNTERHSFAGSISGDIGSYHHNLLVNCTGRNWSLAGGLEADGKTYAGKLDVRNNVVYNYRDRTTDGGVRRINFVNNYYKMGYVSRDMKIFSIDGDQMGYGDMQMAYLSGNKMVKRDGTVVLDSSEDTWKKAGSKFSSVSSVKSDKPFFESYVKTETADEAYNSVINDVGATVPKQDYLDTRYIEETKKGTYTYKGSKDGLKGIIDSQEDVGGYPKVSGGEAPTDTDHDGMPDEWEQLHGLDYENADDRNYTDLSAEGYTNLEMYLNELAGDKVLWDENHKTHEIKTSQPPASDVPDSSEKPQQSSKPSPEKTMPAADINKSEAPSPTSNVDENKNQTTVPSLTDKPIESKKPIGDDKQTSLPATTVPVAAKTPESTKTPENTKAPDDTVLLGDVDMDGSVTLNDAMLTLKAALNIISFNDEQRMLSDVDKDDCISLNDARLVLRDALNIKNE